MPSSPINKISTKSQLSYPAILGCCELLWSLLCGLPSPVAVYTRSLWCQSRAHRCRGSVGSQVRKYNDDVLTPKHRYEDVVASHLGLAIDAEDMQFRMRERRTALLAQLRISYISSGAALHAPAINLVPFHKPLGSVFFSPLRFHLFVSFITLQELFKTVLTNPVVSPCNLGFALLFGRKCHFVSLRVSWPSLLRGNECRC